MNPLQQKIHNLKKATNSNKYTTKKITTNLKAINPQQRNKSRHKSPQLRKIHQLQKTFVIRHNKFQL